MIWGVCVVLKRLPTETSSKVSCPGPSSSTSVTLCYNKHRIMAVCAETYRALPQSSLENITIILSIAPLIYWSIKVLFRNFPEWPEENHEKYPSGYLVSWPRFKRDTSRIEMSYFFRPYINITNSMEQNHSWEANRRSASQEITRHLPNGSLPCSQKPA
jgi:hypothetical protein